MSDPFKFDAYKFEGQPRSGPLAEAAQRLERVASVVKDQQLARTQSGQRRPESEAYVSSPEEAWSKKYMIQCVGPVCTIRPTEEGALLLPRFQPMPEAKAPEKSVAVTAAPAVSPAPAPEKPLLRKGKTAAEPIGVLIGKKVRKRSLLGRMFAR